MTLGYVKQICTNERLW